LLSQNAWSCPAFTLYLFSWMSYFRLERGSHTPRSSASLKTKQQLLVTRFTPSATYGHQSACSQGRSTVASTGPERAYTLRCFCILYYPQLCPTVAEIRGHQHHDVFHGTLDESRVISYPGFAHTKGQTPLRDVARRGKGTEGSHLMYMVGGSPANHAAGNSLWSTSRSRRKMPFLPPRGLK
jgi:hypothetical protein